MKMTSDIKYTLILKHYFEIHQEYNHQKLHFGFYVVDTSC